MLQAALNGRRTRADHPAVPVTPDDLAHAARAAVAAGATALHVHPRGDDGAETLEAAPRADTLRALRAACPDVEISVTTGFWITGDAARRLALVTAWTELPDVASVNIAEPGAAELVRALVTRGVRVELGVATAADARLLVASGVAALCDRLLVEVEGDTAAALAQRDAIDRVVTAGDVRLPWLEHGYALATWAVLERAARAGNGLRVGLEDTLVLPDGAAAADNAALVAACRALRARHG